MKMEIKMYRFKSFMQATFIAASFTIRLKKIYSIIREKVPKEVFNLYLQFVN